MKEEKILVTAQDRVDSVVYQPENLKKSNLELWVSRNSSVGLILSYWTISNSNQSFQFKQTVLDNLMNSAKTEKGVVEIYNELILTDDLKSFDVILDKVFTPEELKRSNVAVWAARDYALKYLNHAKQNFSALKFTRIKKSLSTEKGILSLYNSVIYEASVRLLSEKNH